MQRIVPVGPHAEHEIRMGSALPEVGELGDDELPVRVELEDPLPTGELEAADDGRPVPRVLLRMMDVQPLTSARELVEKARCVVGRAVVDDDHLERLAERHELLLQIENEAFDALGLVETRHDDGQLYGFNHVPICSQLLPAEVGKLDPHAYSMIEVRRKRYGLQEKTTGPAVRPSSCRGDELLFNDLPEGSAEHGHTGVREGLGQE